MIESAIRTRKYPQKALHFCYSRYNATKMRALGANWTHSDSCEGVLWRAAIGMGSTRADQ